MTTSLCLYKRVRADVSIASKKENEQSTKKKPQTFLFVHFAFRSLMDTLKWKRSNERKRNICTHAKKNPQTGIRVMRKKIKLL